LIIGVIVDIYLQLLNNAVKDHTQAVTNDKTNRRKENYAMG